jgi:hypothetical protein
MREGMTVPRDRVQMEEKVRGFPPREVLASIPPKWYREPEPV